jgi:nitrilase
VFALTAAVKSCATGRQASAALFFSIWLLHFRQPNQNSEMVIQHPKFRAAAVQAAPAFLDLDAGIAKAVKLIEEAAAHGAKLIAFPETWLPGDPWSISLDSPAWGMQFVQRYHDNSLVYGSPQVDRLAQAEKDNAITVVMGHSEKSGGSLYIAQWIIDAQGNTVAARRKLKPTHVERTV